MCAAVSPGKRRAGEDSRGFPSPLVSLSLSLKTVSLLGAVCHSPSAVFSLFNSREVSNLPFPSPRSFLFCFFLEQKDPMTDMR